MKSRAINTTKVQDEFRSSILRKSTKKKATVVKRVYKDVPVEITMTPAEKNDYYINNCMFWITEFRYGNCDKAKAKSAAISLIELFDELDKIRKNSIDNNLKLLIHDKG